MPGHGFQGQPLGQQGQHRELVGPQGAAPVRGTAVQGTAIQGTAVQDTTVQDSAVQGAAVQDSAVRDTAVQGTAVRDSGLAVRDSGLAGRDSGLGPARARWAGLLGLSGGGFRGRSRQVDLAPVEVRPRSVWMDVSPPRCEEDAAGARRSGAGRARGIRAAPAGYSHESFQTRRP